MLLLLRHGDAVDESVAGLDNLRWLTQSGRDATVATAEQARIRAISPDVILCSPLVRAVQTAEIFASVLGFKGVIEIETGLLPAGSRLSALSKRMQDAQQGRTCVWVGHEPSMSQIASQLLGATDVDGVERSELLAFTPTSSGFHLAWRCVPTSIRYR